MLRFFTFIKQLLDRKIAAQLEGGYAWEIGRIQFDYLLKEGLNPEHKLLDLPCGSFRAGHLLINYLSEHNYYGIDGSKKNIDNGIKYVLTPAKLILKHPSVYVVKLCSEPVNFLDITKTKFDYIWCHALFDHIPHQTIKQLLADLSKIMLPQSYLYATIFLNPHGPAFMEPIIRPWNDSFKKAVVTFPDKEYYHHTLQFFEETISEIPELKLEDCLLDYPHPLGLRILKFKRV